MARKKGALSAQQAYDSTLKSLFDANTKDMLSFITGVPLSRQKALGGGRTRVSGRMAC